MKNNILACIHVLKVLLNCIYSFRNFTTVSIDLYPSTADKLDEQYVRMTLQFILNEEVNNL